MSAPGGSESFAWVHNECVDKRFLSSYKGKPVEFENPVETCFFRRSDIDADLVRREFNSTRREKFIQKVESEEASIRQLKKAGMTEEQIADMRTFDTLPDNKWQVHHKQSIELGGGNDDDNLMIF